MGIIDYGKLIALGTPEELKAGLGNYCVEFFHQAATERRFFATRQQAKEYAQGRNSDTVTVRRSSLEDVFVELTGREARELASV